MRALLVIAALAAGCAGSSPPPAPEPPAGERRARAGAPVPDPPPPRWWTRGDRACPDGARLERREQPDGRVLTCRRGDVAHGPEIAWHESGVRRWERTYAGGELHGLWVRWYPSGARRSEIPYLHGQREGAARRWKKGGELLERTRWRDGQIEERSSYDAGQLQRTVSYHPSGQRESDYRYADGVRHGDAVTWHPNGTVASRGSYAGGKKEGSWVYSDDEGRVLRTESYQEGELVSRSEGGESEEPLPDHLATGIAACDELIRTARSCQEIPPASRAAYEKAAKAWKRAVDSGGAQSERLVRRACEQAKEAWVESFRRAGCSL